MANGKRQEHYLQDLIKQVDEVKLECQQGKVQLSKHRAENEQLKKDLRCASGILKRVKESPQQPLGGPSSTILSKKNNIQDIQMTAEMSRSDLKSPGPQAGSQVINDKEFQVWLKHLQDSYESRIQPKLAEIASLRQELLSAKNELAKIKIQKQVESSHVPDSNENQSAQVDALKAKVSDTEQSLREGKQ